MMVRAPATIGMILLAGLVGAGLRAADTDRSPFMPPGAQEGAASTITGPNGIELRGIMSADGVVKYNIYDPAHKSSVWVGVNEPGNGFVITSGDPDHDRIVIAAGGQSLTLSLKEAKTVTAAANGLPQGGVVLRPTPADEAARLQAVADEVRRRRLLREQAAAQQQNRYPPGYPGLRQ